MSGWRPKETCLWIPIGPLGTGATATEICPLSCASTRPPRESQQRSWGRGTWGSWIADFELLIGNQGDAMGNRKLKIEHQRLRSPSSSASAASPTSGGDSCCLRLNQLI